jgi:excisionase family DNA binding protein
VCLPEAGYAVLVDVVQAMQGGRTITVAPTSTRLTTQEAADLLGGSRPNLGEAARVRTHPYEQPGRHRRVRLANLLAYRDALEQGFTVPDDFRALTG